MDDLLLLLFKYLPLSVRVFFVQLVPYFLILAGFGLLWLNSGEVRCLLSIGSEATPSSDMNRPDSFFGKGLVVKTGVLIRYETSVRDTKLFIKTPSPEIISDSPSSLIEVVNFLSLKKESDFPLPITLEVSRFAQKKVIDQPAVGFGRGGIISLTIAGTPIYVRSDYVRSTLPITLYAGIMGLLMVAAGGLMIFGKNRNSAI